MNRPRHNTVRLRFLLVIPALTASMLWSQNQIDRAQEAVQAANANVNQANEIVATDQPEPVAPAPQESTSTSSPAVTDMTFDLDYPDTPVRTVLRNVADAAELNVVIPDALVGNVSLQLRGVTWQQVFDIALSGTGFVWHKDDRGIIRIQRISADQLIQVADDGRVSVRFRDEPLRSAVQALAEVKGLDIILPAEMPGSTSATLTNATWERVLTSILQENDFQWFEQDGVIQFRMVDSRVLIDNQTGLLTIDVVNTPFQEVITLIGRTQNPIVNVVSPPEIENVAITLNVDNVSFEQALELAIIKLPRITVTGPEGEARARTFHVHRDGPTLVRIVDGEYLARLRSEPPVVRIFNLRYAQATQVLDMLMPYNRTTPLVQRNYFRTSAAEGISPVVNGLVSIVADPANNLLIVTANANSLSEVSSLVETLDQPVKQILIESKFVEVFDVDEKNLGIDWTSLSGYEIGANNMQREWSRGRTRTEGFDRTNIQEQTSFRRSGSGTGASFNVGGVDVSTEEGTGFNSARFVDNTTGDVLLDATNSFDSRQNIFFSERENNNLLTQFTESVGTTSRVDSAIFNLADFNLILRALERNTDSKILTNPNVVAINGQEAVISLGDFLYKPGEIEQTQGAGTTRGSPVPLDVQPVTKLTVRPSVVGGNLISLEVKPEVNNRVGTQDIDGNEIPTIRERTTESTVLLRSGFTLAIGGLMEEDTRLETTKVPILGDIPVLGRLFSSEQTRRGYTNQIIFITASLLNPQTTDYQDVIGIERLNQMGLTDRDVQGIGARRMSDEELQLQQAIRRARNEAAEQERMQLLRQQPGGNTVPDEAETGAVSNDEAPAGVSFTLPSNRGPRGR